MKKKIVLFEPNKLLINTLLEQMSLNKDLEINKVSNLEGVQNQLMKSPFDLIIIGTNKEAYSLSLVRKFIKEAKITNNVLFMIEAGLVRTFALADNTDNHYFIERPFRIHHFNKKISTILAKVSNPNELIHKLGPFIFFPLKKALMLGEKTKVELTEKEVDILQCLINSGQETVDRDTLLKTVWNYSPDVTTHTLETHIYRLRQKLEIDASIPRLIISKDGGFTIGSL